MSLLTPQTRPSGDCRPIPAIRICVRGNKDTLDVFLGSLLVPRKCFGRFDGLRGVPSRLGCFHVFVELDDFVLRRCGGLLLSKVSGGFAG